MNARPQLALVAIISTDGFISKDVGVPWSLPRDKAHFRQVTAGQWVLAGRRTFEEMIDWFGDRRPLLLTRDTQRQPPVGRAVGSIEEALDVVGQSGGRELFVLGGGGPFAAAMPWSDRLIITHVAATLGSGVPFPPIDPAVWQVVSRSEHPADAANPLAMSFVTYARHRVQPDAPTGVSQKNSVSKSIGSVSKCS